MRRRGKKSITEDILLKKILTHEYYDGILLNVANEQPSCFERKADKKKFRKTLDAHGAQMLY
ncbi:prephenate dehydrogenase [Bacillus altitudinis]|nr:prephenate dehydrogenase [Bacillus pumilus]